MYSEIHWEPLAGGALAIDHRPKLKAMQSLKEAGATHVFTLLSLKEGGPEIGRAARDAGLEWLWLPLPGAKPPEPELDEPIKIVFEKVETALGYGARIFLHCSAGIHRTGMISHALMRLLGQSPEAAREKLRALRQVTGEGVGDERLAWGNEFAARVRDQGAEFRV